MRKLGEHWHHRASKKIHEMSNLIGGDSSDHNYDNLDASLWINMKHFRVEMSENILIIE